MEYIKKPPGMKREKKKNEEKNKVNEDNTDRISSNESESKAINLPLSEDIYRSIIKW